MHRLGLALIWAIALGSGTSGGVLAPLLMLGGILGALESTFLPGGDKALWPLVSMAAVLGGTMRCPLTGAIFTLELTHDVNALLPLLIALYDVTVRGQPGQLFVAVGLGAAALAAPGTLLAGITSQARRAAALLPLLLFPTVVPAVLAASRATTLVIEGDPMEQVPAWLAVLGALNLVHWTASGLLFRWVVEDV